MIDSKYCKEIAFRHIANSTKMKVLLEALELIADKGKGSFIIRDKNTITKEEIAYLQDTKGFEIKEDNSTYIIRWI